MRVPNDLQTEVWGGRISLWRGSNDGQPVIFIHGGGSDYRAFSWRLVAPYLDPARQFIAPDLPGYGHSATGPDYCSRVDIPAALQAPVRQVMSAARRQPLDGSLPVLGVHCCFVPALMDALELDRAALVGLSMGGAIALIAALAFPERISRIALVNAYGVGPAVRRQFAGWLTARIPAARQILRVLLTGSETMMYLALTQLVANRKVISRELIHDAQESIRLVGSHPLWKQFVAEEIGPFAVRTRPGLLLSQLSLPCLLLQGERDPLIPAHYARAAAGESRYIQHVSLPGCGHIAGREKPAELMMVLNRFLSDG